MMAEFIRYELCTSFLVAIAAVGFECVCALYRWSRRFLWVVAMATVLMFPISMAFTTKPDKSTNVETSLSLTWTPAMGTLGQSAPPPPRNEASPNSPVMTIPDLGPVNGLPATISFPHDRTLKLAWLGLSITWLAYYGFVWIRLKRKVALAEHQELDGIRIRVTDRLGPAAFGVFYPEIFIPRWILEAPPFIRSFALEHERQHIVARDPALLFGGSIAVALMPWNVVLWWMLRRLRFCLEADCDGRVLRTTSDARTYAKALLAVCQHHAFAPSGTTVLTSSASWLERRIRIMFSGTSKLSRLLAASGSAWALGLLVVTILLRAPSLAAPVELHKLPPYDTKPSAALVRSIAHTRFPELFDPSFKGMAQVIMVLNRDGSVLRALQKTYASGELPRFDLSRIAEAAEAKFDEGDVLYSDVLDMNPVNRDGSGKALGYIEYAVLKWPHDSMRSEAAVRSAIEAYLPELRTTPTPGGKSICVRHVAVLMNDDGSIRQAHKSDIACHRNDEEFTVSLSPEEENRLVDFGAPKNELGRSGLLTVGADGQFVQVHYTWPRHADDPRDVVELSQGRVNAVIWQQHNPRQDTRDDSAIMARYFPEIVARGNADLFRTIDGRRYRSAPWILFGRDGKIWQTGRALFPITSANTYGPSPALKQMIEARYPGIRVWGSDGLPRVRRVMIYSFWISPDSPVQKMSRVDFGHRKDLLVTTDFLNEILGRRPDSRIPNPIVNSFAQAMNFGTPVGIGLTQYLNSLGHSPTPVSVRVIATKVGREQVDLELQTRLDTTASLLRPPTAEWARAATVRVSYGSSGTIDLFNTNTDPPSKLQIVLRPQRLSDGFD